MRIVLLSLLTLLSCTGIHGDVPVDTFAPNFKDPYSGFHDALLDIDVQLPLACQQTLKVQVILPTISTGESNAHFQGPAFGPRTIAGVTQHNAVTTNAWADVAFDGANTLTFTNFVAAIGPSSQGAGWINFNFDIPDQLFNSPTALGFVDDPTKVPLDMVYNTDYPLSPPPNPLKSKFINLVFDGHFAASTNDPSNCGNAGGHGDPVFSGFQGQSYQFHGLPDEHFNLVSSPDVSLNAHFVYLSSGKCDYNDTECYTHPGTYMDVLGLSVGETHVKLVAGTHDAGLRLWINDKEIRRGSRFTSLNNNITSSLRYHHNGHVEIRTEIMNFEIVNSDMFMNIRAALNDQQLLHVGSIRHTITDKPTCKLNADTDKYQVVEQAVTKKYPVTTPLHGLIGQTWRNVQVCGRDWMGTVQDYLVSDLFANDNHYNYFKW